MHQEGQWKTLCFHASTCEHAPLVPQHHIIGPTVAQDILAHILKHFTKYCLGSIPPNWTDTMECVIFVNSTGLLRSTFFPKYLLLDTSNIRKQRWWTSIIPSFYSRIGVL